MMTGCRERVARIFVNFQWLRVDKRPDVFVARRVSMTSFQRRACHSFVSPSPFLFSIDPFYAPFGSFPRRLQCRLDGVQIVLDDSFQIVADAYSSLLKFIADRRGKAKDKTERAACR